MLDDASRDFLFDLLGTPTEARDHGAGEAIDREARDAYRARAREIEEELREAEEWNDAGRVERLRAELEAIASELSRSLGLGGKPRQDKSSRERARINVQRRIKDAIKRIGEHDQELARRLGKDVKTGTFCRYEPL